MRVYLVAKRLPKSGRVYLSGPGEWTHDPLEAMWTNDKDLAERDVSDWVSYYVTKGWRGADRYHVAEFEVTELEALDA